jgi:hypothetical protein
MNVPLLVPGEIECQKKWPLNQAAIFCECLYEAF